MQVTASHPRPPPRMQGDHSDQRLSDPVAEEREEVQASEELVWKRIRSQTMASVITRKCLRKLPAGDLSGPGEGGEWAVWGAVSVE